MPSTIARRSVSITSLGHAHRCHAVCSQDQGCGEEIYQHFPSTFNIETVYHILVQPSPLKTLNLPPLCGQIYVIRVLRNNAHDLEGTFERSRTE